MRKTIQVTQRNIDQGKAFCSKRLAAKAWVCPVALAARRVFRTKDVQAYEDELVVRENRFEVPAKVSDFIDRFDHGESVKPFSFTVNWKAERTTP